MDNNEKKQSRRTILLTVGCGILATAGIIFFILGLLKFNDAKRASRVIYVDTPFDPAGEEAEENAKVDLVYAQMMFEDKNQVIERVNLTDDVNERTYIGERIYAYEREYVNEYGQQWFHEILWASNDDYVKRFTGDHFVGYAFNVEGKAVEYVQSKEHPLVLNAYIMDFESNNGATSFFTSDDEYFNELYAHYTHTEYDPENLQLFRIGLYVALEQVTVTPAVDDSSVDFLVFSPRDKYDYDDMPGEWGWRNDNSKEKPVYDSYALIPDYFFPAGDDYSKTYVQSKNGYYGSASGYSSNNDDMNEFYIGYISSGNKVTEFKDILLNNGWALEGDEYVRDESGYKDEVLGKYTYHVKLSYVSADDKPSFEKGVMLVDHSRTWEPVE